MPKVHVLTFRDEFRQEPRQLAAFADEGQALAARDALQRQFRELWNSRCTVEQANDAWRANLARQRIPEDRWFDIDMERHTNAVFEVKELELIDSPGE